MLLIMMIVVVVVDVVVVIIFIWLPRNVLVGLNSWCGHWHCIRLRRSGEL